MHEVFTNKTNVSLHSSSLFLVWCNHLKRPTFPL